MTMTKNILLYSIIGGLFLILFIPFFVPSGMFFPFITGKGFAFRILVEIIFGLFVILALIFPEYRPKNSWITKSVLLFTLVILVADLFGVNVYKSLWSNYERMEGFVLILHLALFYIVSSSVFRNVSKWSRYFNVSIFASVLMSIYGVLQIIGKIAIDQGTTRVDATLGNASYFAIYLVFHIFLCLYFLVDWSRPKWQKWIYGLIALFETAILYYTATRGAILGLIGGLILAGLLIAWKEKENLIFRKISYWILGAILLFIAVFTLVRNTSFVRNNQVLGRFSSLSIAEFQTQGRYFVWPMAMKGVIEHPILGWGQENFNFVFNKYYDPRMYAQEQWFDRTHDVVLDWLIAGGILGFLAYVSMYVALFYYIWRRDSLLRVSEKSILTGMIAAYIFHNIFVFDNLVSYFLFFAILAFIHSVSTERKETLGQFYTKTFSPGTTYSLASVFLVLTILIIYFVNVPAISANQTLISAISPQGDPLKNLEFFKKVYDYNSFGSRSGEATEQLVSISTQLTSAPDTIKTEFFNLSKKKLEEKISQTPHDARYLVFAGSFFNRFGQYDTAIEYLDKAIVESPKKQTIYFEKASSYLGKGDTAKAFEQFKIAYELEKKSPESQILYAVGAIYTSNAEALKEVAGVIPPDTVVSDNRFLQAYAAVGNYNAAITILNARLQKDPTNQQYKLSLASAYATLGQKQKAISLIQEIIAQDPTFKEQGEGYIKQIQNS
jgi:O-antigen ligase/tetratricopeptide (TPR) repeat protein